MKKLLFTIILCVLFIPNVMAKTYSPSETDVTLTFDETKWYVFTLDNLKNNKELQELGITEEYMVKNMKDNYIYVDAVLYFEDSEDYIEFFVRKKKMPNVNNLSKYPDKEVKTYSEELAKIQNTENFDIYKTQYKYARLKYPSEGFYLNEYYTIVNGYGYTFTAQKPMEYTEKQSKMVEEIMSKVTFKVDDTLPEQALEKSGGLNSILKDAIIGATTGTIISVVYAIKNKKSKKKQKEKN